MANTKQTVADFKAALEGLEMAVGSLPTEFRGLSPRMFSAATGCAAVFAALKPMLATFRISVGLLEKIAAERGNE